jgi:hypothetical protein
LALGLSGAHNAAVLLGDRIMLTACRRRARLGDLHGPRGLDAPGDPPRLLRSLFNLLSMDIPPGLAAVWQVLLRAKPRCEVDELVDDFGTAGSWGSSEAASAR